MSILSPLIMLWLFWPRPFWRPLNVHCKPWLPPNPYFQLPLGQQELHGSLSLFNFTVTKTGSMPPHSNQIFQHSSLYFLLPAKLGYWLAISGTYSLPVFLSTFIQTVSSFSNVFLSWPCLSKCLPYVIYALITFAQSPYMEVISLFNTVATHLYFYLRSYICILQAIHSRYYLIFPSGLNLFWGRTNVWCILESCTYPSI